MDDNARITKGNWKRFICMFIGHKKIRSFAYPAIHWSCSRCGHDYFKQDGMYNMYNMYRSKE